MTTIRSNWSGVAPSLTGTLDASDWSGATTLPIPRGMLLAKNDDTHLYIGLDLTDETGVANPDDYFWFIVDVNDNGAIDSMRDKLFSDWPGDPNRLGMWYMAGPDENWPASNTEVIPSQVRIGFGASLNSATPHRQWQISFALSDLDIATIDSSGPAPIVRFGLRIATLSGFVGETPANPLGDFSQFHEIILSTVPTLAPPPGDAGPVIARVGIIGTGLISADGYCNIPTPYYIMPQDAAFSGTLHLIGNVATLTSLWGSGARTYQVLHRYGNTAATLAVAAWSPLLQVWSNFEIVGPNDVWQSFAPDASGSYPLVDPSLPYTIQHLLFQWTTSSEPDGLHQFQIHFFDAANAPVASTPQVLTIKLDNQLPIVDLIDVLHGGTSVPSCSIVDLGSTTDGVQLVYEAFDPEGDLYLLELSAEYGKDVHTPVYTDSYSAHANPAHNWQGVTTDTRPASPAVWVPPYTCAYLFRITAYSRTTNGYQFPVLWSTSFRTVTLIKPGVIQMPAQLSGSAYRTPRGFEAFQATAPTGADMPVKALPVKP